MKFDGVTQAHHSIVQGATMHMTLQSAIAPSKNKKKIVRFVLLERFKPSNVQDRWCIQDTTSINERCVIGQNVLAPEERVIRKIPHLVTYQLRARKKNILMLEALGKTDESRIHKQRQWWSLDIEQCTFCVFLWCSKVCSSWVFRNQVVQK